MNGPLATIAAVIALVIGVTACPRDDRKTANRTSTAVPLSATTSATTPLPRWDSAVGAALLLATDSFPDSVFVIRPEYVPGQYTDTSTVDLRGLGNASFDLFGRGGTFGNVRLTALPSTRHARGADGCLDWPVAAVSPARSGWHVALSSARAASVPLDSIEVMPPADSALVTAQAARLASMLPGADSTFRGIPYTVRTAYRFRTAVIDGMIASLSRSIPSEATPREEHLFLVAERPVGGTQDYHVAFSLRSTGKEEATAITDVLAVVTLAATQRPLLLISNEGESGATVGMIERVAPGEWQLAWRSAYTGC